MTRLERRAFTFTALALVIGCSGPSKDDASAPSTPPGPTTCEATTANPCATPSPDDPDSMVTSGPGGTLVDTRGATALGLTAFSVNGGIQPGGKPTTYHFEYGKTTAYGSKTTAAPLPPQLTAHYSESWKTGLSGWAGGMDGSALKYIPSGGVEGGFVRYSMPGDIDAAHADGIGANELVQYMYPSAWDGGVEYAAFGGGDPDMRGARISTHVRGNDFVPRRSELVFWLQSTPNLAESYGNDSARWSNWAFSGSSNLTDGLMAGGWQKVDYRLINDTRQWTYAGHSVDANRASYIYVPLDQVLGHLNGDFFHMLMFFEFSEEPSGSIDIDELEVTYRNWSLLQPGNGGRLVAAPVGPDDPTRLLDGWRHGPNRTWRSAPSPTAPLEFEYELATPVTLSAVQLHQNPEWPSKDIEVLVSADGTTYQPLARGVIPATAPAGANFAFYLNSPERVAANVADGIPVLPWLDTKVKRIKVRVLSGYKPEFWGLGEIEVFGKGATVQTDNDWYSVTADIPGLVPGETYHYRLVAETDAGITFGADRTYVAPAVNKPMVTSCVASRVRNGTAKVEGRVNPLGISTQYFFEYGLDKTYGSQTLDRYGGLEITPRTVTDAIDGLEPGKTYHCRVVAVNASGISYGDDTTFVAK